MMNEYEVNIEKKKDYGNKFTKTLMLTDQEYLTLCGSILEFIDACELARVKETDED